MTTQSEMNLNYIDIKTYDNCCVVKLQNYTGNIEIPEGTTQLKISALGENVITNDLILQTEDKSDRIIVSSQGICQIKLQKLQATVVEILTNTTVQRVFANIIKIQECTVSILDSSDVNLYAKGHIWFLDSIITGYVEGILIHTPYLLIENCTLNFTATDNVFDVIHRFIPYYCREISDPQIFVDEWVQPVINSFSCVALNVDENNIPKYFQQTVIQTAEGQKGIIDRRKLQTGSQIYHSWLPATPFDDFKESTHYTSVNLHRHATQTSPILSRGIDPDAITPENVIKICNDQYDFSNDVNKYAMDLNTISDICNDPTYIILDDDDQYPMDVEVVQQIIDDTYVWPHTNEYSLDEQDSRHYTAGIYDLHSYRTTEIQFHSEALNTDELP